MKQIASQTDSLSSSATSKAKAAAKSAIDSVNMDGLTDEMKSALKSAIDSNVSVSAEPSSIEISGLTSDAEKSIRKMLQVQRSLHIGKVECQDSVIWKTLLKDMKTQAAVS